MTKKILLIGFLITSCNVGITCAQSSKDKNTCQHVEELPKQVDVLTKQNARYKNIGMCRPHGSKKEKKQENASEKTIDVQIPNVSEPKVENISEKSDPIISVTGNINAFAVYYPNQRIGSTNYTTNPTLVMMDGQVDENNESPAAQKNQFMLSADETTLSTKIKHKDFLAALDIGVFANTPSNGSVQSPTFYVSDVHADFMNFTIGYTTSNFEDTDALGTWLSMANSQQINYGICSVLIKYGFDLSKSIRASVALENPVQDGLQQDVTNSIKSAGYGRIQESDITFNIRYTMDKGFVGLRLLERKLLQSMNNTAYTDRGYGAAVSGRFNFENKSYVYAQVVYGKGIGCYLGELLGYSFLFDTTGNPQLKALDTYSYVIGTVINLTDECSLNVAYQANHIDYPTFAIANNTDNSATTPNFDRDHQKILANILYKMNDHVQVGVEGAYITRKIANTVDGSTQKSANAQSVMFGMKYIF
jgi:opacity protein-like surface antigen